MRETSPIQKPVRDVPEPETYKIEESELALLLNRDKNTRFEDVVIDADLYTARINPKGAVVSSWKLKSSMITGIRTCPILTD